MLEIVWAFTVGTAKVFGLVLAAYIFYWRVWDYFCGLHFYKSQGPQVCAIGHWHMPVIGNAYLLAWSAYKSYMEGDNYFIMKHAFDLMILEKSKTAICFMTNGAGLGIADVKVVEALYTTKNKYFDKHPLVKDLSECLTGESILFAETSDDWRKSRKAMSPAFYKGKLEQLVEIAKGAVEKTRKRFVEVAQQGPGT